LTEWITWRQGLNFSVGAIIGLSELDVDNLELLAGASSALYGPGGMNGTLLMTSKNPFKYQGLSFLVKEGIMHTDGKQRILLPIITGMCVGDKRFPKDLHLK
jgi:hypothetical protein